MKTILAANWKMNLSAGTSRALAQAFVELSRDLTKTEVWIAPTFTAIPGTAEVVSGSNVKLGAQNVWGPEGAFTGEVSAGMLKVFGCSFAFVGHSERRHIFGESDDTVVRRALVGIDSQLCVIFCVGETLSERESKKTESVLERQVSTLIDKLEDRSKFSLVLAYEPVWAIGTGKVASIKEIEDAHGFLKDFWKKRHPSHVPPILYGGSVTSDNFAEIATLKDVSGGLIGGASLSAEKFRALVQISEARD